MDSSFSPPAFAWDEWYASVGGRTIDIPELQQLLDDIRNDQYKRFESGVSPVVTEFESPVAAAAAIKLKATELGADMVGICEIEPSDVYRGKVVTDKYAIALGQRMKWREFQVVPSRESAIESMRVYHSLGEIIIQLAYYIRSLGYPCKIEHPIGDSDLLHIPIGLKAGFGELGRHGSIIHPTIGPLFRMGSIATSMALAIDQPVDAGIAAFCDKCKACRIYCPPKAIPDERSPSAGKDHIGKDRYLVDTGRCFPYFAKHDYCSICLPVCVYNHKEWARDFEGFKTSLWPTIVMEEPPPVSDSVPDEKKHRYNKLRR
jgi:epoxyqueuosine reductase